MQNSWLLHLDSSLSKLIKEIAIGIHMICCKLQLYGIKSACLSVFMLTSINKEITLNSEVPEPQVVEYWNDIPAKFCQCLLQC